MKRRRKLALGIGISLVLLGSGIALLHTPLVRRLVAQQIRDYLLETSRIDLEIANLSYNLLALSADVERLRLRSVRAAGLPPLLEIDSAHVDLGWLSLLRGRIGVEAGRFDGVRIALVTDETGNTNLPGAGEPTQPGEPRGLPVFLIESLQTHSGSLSFEDRARKLRAELPLWSLGITGDRDTVAHEIRFELGREGSVVFDGRRLPVRHLRVVAELTLGGANLKDLRLTAGNSRLQARGSLMDFARPSIAATAALTVDVGQTARWAGLREPLDGDLNAEFQINGQLDSLRVSAQWNGRGLAARGLRGGVLAAETTWDQGAQRLELRSLSLRSPSGSIRADGSFALAAADGPSRIRASVENLDLNRLSRELGVPLRVAGRASASLRADWEGVAYDEAEAAATVRLAATGDPAPGVLPVAGALRVAVGAGRVLGVIEHLEVLGSELRGNIELASFDRLSGDLQATVPDLATLVGGAEAFLGREPGSLTGAGLGGSLQASVRLAGSVTRPEAAIELESGGLDFGRVKGAALSLSGAYSPDSIRLHELQASWGEQKLSVRGSAGLAGETPTLNLQAELHRASLADIAAGLGQELPVTGVFTGEAALTGTLHQPIGRLALSADEWNLYGEEMGRMAVEATLEGQRLELARLELTKPSAEGPPGRLLLTGAYDLATQTYTVNGAGARLVFQRLALPGAVIARGAMSLSVQGEGTVQRPGLAAELRLDDLDIAGRALGAVTAKVSAGRGSATLELEAPKLGVRSHGRIQLAEPFPAELTLTADRTDLALFGVALSGEEKLAGVITIRADAAANLTHWASGRASVTIDELLLKLRGQEIRNQTPVKFAWADRTLHFDPSTISAGESRLTLAGSIPAAGKAAERPLHFAGDFDLAGLLAFLPPMPGVGVSGRLKLAGEVRGSFERLDPWIQLETADTALVVPVLDSPVAGIALDVRYEGGSVALRRIEAEVGRGVIRAQGVVPLASYMADLPLVVAPATGPAGFGVEIRNLELSAFAGVPEGISGVADMSAEGQLPRLDDWTAVIAKGRLERLQLRIADYELGLAEPAAFSASHGVARIDQFRLTGPDTHIDILGTAGLRDPRPLDVRISGNLDTAVLTQLSDSFKVAGRSELALAISGTMAAPRIDGYFEMPRGRATLPSPRLAAENLDLRIRLSENEIALERLTGTLNGGDLTGSGAVRFQRGGIENLDLRMSAKDTFFEFPEGLNTRINADLQLRSQDEATVLGGKVTILEGAYRELLELERAGLKYLESSGGVEFAEERSPFLQNLRFNVAIETENPVVVENNLMEGLVQSNLNLVGTFYRPSLTGRLTIDEGAEIYLSERRYLLERGQVTFTNQTRIEPNLDILARTRAGRWDIELRVEGEPGDISATFSSDPPLSQPDIVSVLLTGRTLEQVQGAELNVAKEQVLSYLSGRAASRVSRRAQETLGLSQVRIEPNLIAAESNPGARLTLGQDLTDFLRFIYSMNLADSSDQIQVLEYDLARRFTARSTRQQDNTYRFDFDHDVRWGGPKEEISPKREAAGELRIGSIAFSGDPVFDEDMVRRKLHMKPGDRYDFFRTQKSLERLEKFYTSRHRLESTVRAQRQRRDGQVDLTVTIDAGPQVEFVFEGFQLPGSVRNRIRRIWREGIVDSQRSQDSVRAIRRYLVQEGYLQAEVVPQISFPTEGVKRVTFGISPRVRYKDVELVFEGVKGISAEALLDVLDAEKARLEIYTSPRTVADLLARYYRDQGYLAADIGEPRYELDPETGSGRVVLPVAEGPLFRVGTVRFSGNRAIDTPRLMEALALSSGGVYRPELVETSITRLEELYWSDGYNDVAIAHSLEGKREDGLVDVTFQITENRQQVVSGVEVVGTHETSEKFARNQIELAPGDVLDFNRVNRTRKNLYNTGAYALVDVQPTPAGAASDLRNPQLLRVKLREVRPFNIRYGASYDTDRGPGFIADFTNRNTLGSARVLGFRARYDPDFRELRGYISQPLLRRWPVKTNLIGFTSREVFDTFITDRTGFSVNQEAHLWGNTIVSYGYRIERTDTFDKDPESLFQVPPFTIAPLTLSWTRETRDDFLDATRGSLMSHAFEYAPAGLGSDLRFVKYFGQYFKYVGLTRPAEVPFGGGVRRPRVVYAGAVRLGLANGLGGQDLIRTERFFAGGGTTLRGFDKDSVGPADFFGPTGGNAVFLTNNEIRFPLVGFLDGVGFLDLGNVYRNIGDFDPLNLRKSAGFGLRVRTPYFLLRLDYGFILDRRPGERRGGFFFSIGQAF